MSKINEAKTILKEIGMPARQQNEISALTLLALAQLTPKMAWSKAETKLQRIHDILGFCAQHYKKVYAENTREVFRRQVIHQFEHARIVDRNPDDLSRPTNSGLTCYRLTSDFIKVLHNYKSKDWSKSKAEFINSQGKLKDKYNVQRQRTLIPIRLPDGSAFNLSPGKHNELQVQVIKQFGATFAPNSVLLYLGDTAKKNLYLDKDRLAKLEIPVTEHEKLPDIVLFDEKRKWLFMIEVVTSHGPVTPKRKHELEKMLSKCWVKRVYVSAFPTFEVFKKWSNEVAWETEVWIADIPNHMIHYNGEHFL